MVSDIGAGIRRNSLVPVNEIKAAPEDAWSTGRRPGRSTGSRPSGETSQRLYGVHCNQRRQRRLKSQGLPTNRVFQSAASAGLRGRPVSWCWFRLLLEYGLSRRRHVIPQKQTEPSDPNTERSRAYHPGLFLDF